MRTSRRVAPLMPQDGGGLAKLTGAAARLALAVACVIASGFVLSGCATMALYTIGHAADDHSMKPAPRPACGYASIRPGERMALELRDGRRVTGRFYDLDCGADTSIVLAPYAATSWDVPFGDRKEQRIPLSTVRTMRVSGHGFRTAALIVGIPIDVTLGVLLVMWASGLSALGD